MEIVIENERSRVFQVENFRSPANSAQGHVYIYIHVYICIYRLSPKYYSVFFIFFFLIFYTYNVLSENQPRSFGRLLSLRTSGGGGFFLCRRSENL